MNLFADIRSLIVTSLDALVAAGDLPEGLNYANVAVEPPRDPAHGDMATNAAMALAKAAKTAPRELAAKLAPKLAEDNRIDSADIAGPGFINLRLAPTVWLGAFGAAIEAGPRFGAAMQGAGKKVNVE